jgi:metallo-beta-lactamase family protein
MHLVHVGGKRVLLDCGMYQGRRKVAFERNKKLPFDPKSVDAVILSHAHIDHSGNLPSLVRGGFKGPIYATSATRDLAAFMLLDSAKIQVNDVKYVNKKRKRKNQKPFEPLYDQQHAAQTLRQFRTVEYMQKFSPVDGVECEFHFAGHMLGAATVELNLRDKPEDNPTKLVFSGDIGRAKVPILRDPQIVEGADYIIMEATYGNRNHQQGADATKVLKQAAQETFDTNGKLIIPAFSVGRTQEIVYRLNLLAESGELPKIKVFVDSPLAVNATDVFRSHVECFDDDMVNAILEEEDQDPLMFRDLIYVRKTELSKALNRLKEPAIIISASGMCEGGRILHHLKNNIEKENTTVLFAGYQAPHTLGRIILEKRHEKIRIYGEEYELNCKVAKLEGSSGHADQEELLDWAKETCDRGNVKKIALVHCELDNAEEFRQRLAKRKMQPTIIPAMGDEMVME